MIETLTIYFRFPLKNTFKNKQFNFLQENDVLPVNVSKTSLVCSLHFDDSFFVMGKGRRLLLKYAIPSKIINRIKYVCVHFEQIKTKQNNSLTSRYLIYINYQRLNKNTQKQ